MQVVDTYIDDGCTGTNYKHPELKRMLYDIDDRRIDCIVVKDLSRFSLTVKKEKGEYVAPYGSKKIPINIDYYLIRKLFVGMREKYGILN